MQLFSVSEIAQYIRQTLDHNLILSSLWINGEVSNVFRSATGHAYFTLKEGKAASLRCALFRGNHGSELLEDGGEVNVHGRISFYETRGDLQLYADTIQPTGVGVLALEFERLKASLEEEGLFESSRKRQLPEFPRRIGVATSAQGAVFQDICTIIRRRYPLAEIVLCPTSVQGERAAAEVVDAIRTLDGADNDVLIIARGGGSLEDLWAFNTEAVARAIFSTRTPIVSAIGHETDVTLSDLVADYRAPTPSAAAEAVTPDTGSLMMEIQSYTERAGALVGYRLGDASNTVLALVQRMSGRLPNVADLRQNVDTLVDDGIGALDGLLRDRTEQIRFWETYLDALNPSAVLNRGYAVLTRLTTDAPVTQAGQVAAGDLLKATLQDGSFNTRVERS